MNITKDDLAFLIYHKISDNLIIDAEGKPMSNALKDEMKRLEKVFAVNSTPCEKAGHKTRSRAGHCIQCDTSKISYQFREIQYGCVYIAGSLLGRVIKVGSTERREQRAESLNKSKYGNLSDWEVLYSFNCVNRGNVETMIQSKLVKYSWKSKYFHSGHDQNTKELFQCSYKTVKESFDLIKAELKLLIDNEKEVMHKINRYKF